MDESDLPEFFSNMGIECFTSPETAGFHGVIKKHASDFIVTELDINGRPAILDNFVPPPLPKLESPPPRVTDAKRPCSLTTPPLVELIDQEQYRMVSELAMNYITSLDHNVDLSLGSIPDKQTRALIHTAIRLAFPILKTSTIRNEQDQPVICVHPDKKYVQLKELLGHEEAQRLLVFVNTADRSSVHLLPHQDSKDHRTKVHRLLHELYGQVITTKSYTSQHRKKAKLDRAAATGEEECPPQIVIRFRDTVRDNLQRKAGRDVTCGANLYTKFVLCKENVEMLDAIHRLVSALGDCHRSQFAYAGIKDKKAVTSQYVTVRGVSADRLQLTSESPLMAHMKTGNYEYVGRQLNLGELSGNNFAINIRDVVSCDLLHPLVTTVPTVMSRLSERGFVNYFGSQRFGRSLLSPRVGLAMLQGKHMQAVDLIMSPVGEGDATQEAKQYFLTSHDIAGTLDKMPQHGVRELLILKALQRHGYSEFGCTCALMNIPFTSRLMYLHSFTSLVWNHLSSFRVRQYGMEPVEGDLVLRKMGLPEGRKPTWKESVHILTREDIETGEYALRDVVLPCLGTGTIFPNNKVSDNGGFSGCCLITCEANEEHFTTPGITSFRLKELLAATGLTLAAFRLPRLGMHLASTYRRLIAHPKQLEWKWVGVPSNWRAAGEKVSHLSAHSENVIGGGTDQSETNPGSRTEGSHSMEEVSGTEGSMKEKERALKVLFFLEPSCYATMLLREITKTKEPLF